MPNIAITDIKLTRSERHGDMLLATYLKDGEPYTAMAAYTDALKAAVSDFKLGAIDGAAFVAIVDGGDDLERQVAEAANLKLSQVTDHISTDGVHVYFDNADFHRVQLDEALEDHLVRLLRDSARDEASKRDFKSFCAFAENLYANVDERKRADFVKWLDAQGWLTFTDDGCLVGYRGAQVNKATGVAESIHEGPAYVDGVYVNGHVPNPDGAVVTMDRSMVENNPSVGCSTGLHVGTYDYACGWGRDVLLKVKVDPRDVISVPFDCGAQKIRCCRFTVLEHFPLTHDDDYRHDWEDDLTYGDNGYDEDWGDEDDADEDGRDEYSPIDEAGRRAGADAPFHAGAARTVRQRNDDGTWTVVDPAGDVIDRSDSLALTALSRIDGARVRFSYRSAYGTDSEVDAKVVGSGALPGSMLTQADGEQHPRRYVFSNMTSDVTVGEPENDGGDFEDDGTRSDEGSEGDAPANPSVASTFRPIATGNAKGGEAVIRNDGDRPGFYAKLTEVAKNPGTRVRFGYVNAQGTHTEVDARVEASPMTQDGMLTIDDRGHYHRYLFSRIQGDVLVGDSEGADDTVDAAHGWDGGLFPVAGSSDRVEYSTDKLGELPDGTRVRFAYAPDGFDGKGRREDVTGKVIHSSAAGIPRTMMFVRADDGRIGAYRIDRIVLPVRVGLGDAADRNASRTTELDAAISGLRRDVSDRF